MNSTLYGVFRRFLESVKNRQINYAGQPYREPTQVPLAEKAKVFGIINLREFDRLAMYLR